MTKQLKKEKSIEETLWDAANKLRGELSPRLKQDSESRNELLNLFKELGYGIEL